MINPQKHIFNIIQNIKNNVKNKKWLCLIDGCKEDAINSHLLQVNGILSHIVEEGHLIQIKPNNLFEIEKKKSFSSFAKVGINKAISDLLFCNIHDTNIFKEIETKQIDFFNYKSQLLFSYRSLCNELRKKMKNVEFFIRLKNAQSIKEYDIPLNKNGYIDLEIEGHSLGIKDLSVFKSLMEKEIFESAASNFTFKTIELPFIKICASAVSAPIGSDFSAKMKAEQQENPLNTIFINIIPQNGCLYLIIGYHNVFTDKWIQHYLSSWENLNKEQLELELTNLLATKIETWSISPSLFDSISELNKQKFEKYWNENTDGIYTDQEVDFNLFENTT